MRLIPSNVQHSAVSHATALAAVLIPAALLAVAPSVYAQTATDAASASFVVASVNADVVPATTAVSSTLITPAVDSGVQAGIEAGMQPATLNLGTAAAVDQNAASNTDNGTSGANLSAAPLAADPGQAGDEPVIAGVGSIDDQTLSHQRGGAVGMLMVAATPQLMRGGNNVTLWDEIAPPAPLPIPVDSGQAAQGNIASYTRK
ncbi:MAG TPA: hypothetical protein VG320_27545 [Paraburkholderia sp.]|jgi:hypothetical protein|uniref:hypothetical protein n=1 Tax=Paraburkholderia sp. TaxID=1926495 RepID=UPI002DE2C17D|nr:hypothetical protein [Paraburkholderia sp.]